MATGYSLMRRTTRSKQWRFTFGENPKLWDHKQNNPEHGDERSNCIQNEIRSDGNTTLLFEARRQSKIKHRESDGCCLLVLLRKRQQTIGPTEHHAEPFGHIGLAQIGLLFRRTPLTPTALSTWISGGHSIRRWTTRHIPLGPTEAST